MITDDPNNPNIRRGPPDTEPRTQNDTYLALSKAERAKGFIRPVRCSYVHVGIKGPSHPLRDLNEKERENPHDWVKYEPYPAGFQGAALGRMWTQAQLDSVGEGCGAVTKMNRELAETYARQPGFYGATYCIGCSMHLAVGKDGEFVWEETDERVGT